MLAKESLIKPLNTSRAINGYGIGVSSMTRLVKGAKETFGWVVVGPGRELLIPPKAWARYGFQAGEQGVFMKASRRSGGFALTTLRLLQTSSLPHTGERILGREQFTKEGEISIPYDIPIQPGDRLLTVFGSGFALGFITQGPIFEEAYKHPELEVFKPKIP
jgi:hypothetical protein